MGKTSEKAKKEGVASKKRGSPKDQIPDDEVIVPKRGRPARSAAKATQGESMAEAVQNKNIKKKTTRGRGKQTEKAISENESEPRSDTVDEPNQKEVSGSKPDENEPKLDEDEPTPASDENIPENKQDAPNKIKKGAKQLPKVVKSNSEGLDEDDELESKTEPKVKQNKKKATKAKATESESARAKRNTKKDTQAKAEKPPVNDEKNTSSDNEVEESDPVVNKKKPVAATKKKTAQTESTRAKRSTKKDTQAEAEKPPVNEDENTSSDNEESETVVNKKPIAATKKKIAQTERTRTKRTTKKDTQAKAESPPANDEENMSSNNEVAESNTVVTKKKPTAKGRSAKKQVEESLEVKVDTAKTATKSTAGEKSLKLLSWNVGGIRALLKKEALAPLLDEQGDIICMQEVRCAASDLPSSLEDFSSEYPYKYYVDSTSKKGYAGCATWSKVEPLKVQMGIGDEKMDTDGRAITLEFDTFYLVNVYVPNAGRKLITLDKRLQWNKLFEKYCADLDKIKPVVITGDMNVSHKEIDLARPKANVRNAGFTIEERDGMTDFLALGFVDTYRHLHPETVGYTFWTYMGNARAKNVGWRLDYFFVSERITERVGDSSILPEIMGSDHCPVLLQMN